MHAVSSKRQEVLLVYCKSTVLWNTGNLPVRRVKIWIMIAEYTRGWSLGLLFYQRMVERISGTGVLDLKVTEFVAY